MPHSSQNKLPTFCWRYRFQCWVVLFLERHVFAACATHKTQQADPVVNPLRLRSLTLKRFENHFSQWKNEQKIHVQDVQQNLGVRPMRIQATKSKVGCILINSCVPWVLILNRQFSNWSLPQKQNSTKSGLCLWSVPFLFQRRTWKLPVATWTGETGGPGFLFDPIRVRSLEILVPPPELLPKYWIHACFDPVRSTL